MTTDEFALRLLEHLHRLDFDFFITDEKGEVLPPEEVDLTKVNQIAQYLCEDEEWFGDLTEDNQADKMNDALLVANFIYGWEAFRQEYDIA
jgi:hypothetical protein